MNLSFIVVFAFHGQLNTSLHQVNKVMPDYLNIYIVICIPYSFV